MFHGMNTDNMIQALTKLAKRMEDNQKYEPNFKEDADLKKRKSIKFELENKYKLDKYDDRMKIADQLIEDSQI